MFDHELFELLKEKGGCYKCPKDESGRRLGPLVGYTARYWPGNKQYVGESFYNFARIEFYWPNLEPFAQVVARNLREQLGYTRVDWCLGLPMGGMALAQALARELDCRYLYAERQITELATPTTREVSHLVMGRHEIPEGSRGVLVEDVVNNRSTTNKAIQLAWDSRAKVLALAAAINRSQAINFLDPRGHTIRTVSALFLPTEQWHQESPAVADDVKRGNVVWKPKDNWDQLMAVMSR